MPANYANEDGYWESTSLAAMNDRLLEAWSSSWWRPPTLVSDSMVSAVSHLGQEALNCFSRVYGATGNWVWKDPRLTVTLPFWDNVLGDQPVLFVYREPTAVARSIQRRDALTAPQALALWERHTRLAMLALSGRRVLVANYNRLCVDPEMWSEEVATFCASAGLSVREPHTPSLVALIRSRMDDETNGVTPAQNALAQHLRSLDGVHRVFPRVDFAHEERGVAELLEAIVLPDWYSGADT